MPRHSTTSRFDFQKRVAYDPEAKRQFHRRGRRHLRLLATALGLEPGQFDLRSNMGGIAVSGEVTLHSDRLYVQVSQSAMGGDYGILFRSCCGRKDYTGGANHFTSLDWLHRPEALARLIQAAVPQEPTDWGSLGSRSLRTSAPAQPARGRGRFGKR